MWNEAPTRTVREAVNATSASARAPQRTAASWDAKSPTASKNDSKESPSEAKDGATALKLAARDQDSWNVRQARTPPKATSALPATPSTARSSRAPTQRRAHETPNASALTAERLP